MEGFVVLTSLAEEEGGLFVWYCRELLELRRYRI